MGLESFAVNGRRGKHSNPHQRVGIIDLDAYFGRAYLWIEDGTNVTDHSGEDAVGIGCKTNIRLLTEMHHRKIVLIHITNDPDMRQIGDGKGIGRTGISDASSGGSGHILRNDVAGGRRVNLHGRSRMILIHTEYSQLLL